MTEDLPSQLIRTRRFTAGAPDDFAVVAAGRLVTYLRDETLWAYDVANRTERRIGLADSYHAPRSRPVAVLCHESRLWRADLDTGEVERLPVTDAKEPRIDPLGTRVAYVADRALRVVDLDGANDRALLEPEADDVAYGLAEFTAWMSMDRDRGFWWAPDGERLLVARVDEAQVRVFHLADPNRPDAPPQRHRYPAVGTSNADVTMHLATLDGTTREVPWDRQRFEYLARVDWTTERPLLAVQSRDQRLVHLLEVDPENGTTSVVREVTDPAWVTVAEGVPSRTADGRVLWVECDADTDSYRLRVGDELVTPAGLQVRQVTAVDGDTVSFLAQDEPTELHAYVYDADVRRLSRGPGVHRGFEIGGTTVLDSHTVDGRIATVEGNAVASNAETPLPTPRARPTGVGDRELRTVIFRPSWHEPGEGPPLPVLLDPYAGPGLQRVMAWRLWSYPLSQWFAEHGFIVICTDGRGTPGRGPAWERAVHGDIVRPVLDDQVDALHAVAERDGDLDLERVAIRGWSFGGFLAAAAVLHRPDVFHAAVAGAAVSDQRLYDTYWKERFLGHPDDDPEAYRRCSLLPYADRLKRPLLIVQGLADTNVWSLHALRLSAALTAAGKPHRTLLLTGQGHRPTGDLAASLPRIELDFLRRSLGLDGGAGGEGADVAPVPYGLQDVES